MTDRPTPAGLTTDPLRRGLRFVKLLVHSRKAAVVAMALMAAVLGLASLVPELDTASPGRREELKADRPVLAWVGEHLRPRQVARSPLFLLFPAYLFLGISVSIAQRIGQYRSRAGRGSEGVTERFRVERELTLSARGEEAGGLLAPLIRKAGYEIAAWGPDFVLGRRGKAGFFGSIAFHLGLLLVLLGVTVSSFTRLTGEIILTEGFPVPFAPASMLEISGSGRLPELPGHLLSIRDFVADYSTQGTPVDFALLLSVQHGAERLVEDQVRVNQAFRWRGFQITLHRYGFAPELAAWDPSGTKRQDAVSVLQLLPPGREDAVPLEGGGELRVRLFPDFATIKGEPVTRSLKPLRPVILFEWRERGGGVLTRGRVERGGRAELNGYAVAFPSLAYWGGFVVARDEGLPFFVFGAVVGSLGLLVRLAFPDQSIRVEWAPGRDVARLTAGTRFFPALYEERIAQLVRRIEEEARRERA